MEEEGIAVTGKIIVAQIYPEACDMFFGEEGQEKDKDECYAKVAVRNKNIDLCDEIQSNAIKEYQCIKGVAEARQEKSICDKITDQDIKDSCYVGVGK